MTDDMERRIRDLRAKRSAAAARLAEIATAEKAFVAFCEQAMLRHGLPADVKWDEFQRRWEAFGLAAFSFENQDPPVTYHSRRGAWVETPCTVAQAQDAFLNDIADALAQGYDARPPPAPPPAPPPLKWWQTSMGCVAPILALIALYWLVRAIAGE